MSQWLPTDLVFWLFIPGLLLVLAFGWLMFLARGKRKTSLTISGLGINMVLSSSVLTASGAEVSEEHDT